MKTLHLQDILPHIGGVIIKEGSSSIFQKIITRKKNLQAGTLLFCLNRDKFQMKQPLPPSIIVTNNDTQLKNIPGEATIIKVKNIKKSYQSFLSFYRSLFDIPIVGITGTYGKTTTKEMIKHILSGKYKVKATKGNYNLFRSNAAVLTSFDHETEFGVFEFGVGKSGNLDRCCRIFGPFTAVITGIGADHIERFGNVNRYRREKAKILKGVSDNRVAILNADCENTLKVFYLYPKKNILWIGTGNNADFRAEAIKYTKNGMEFLLTYRQQSYTVSVQGFGTHTVYNAMAAIAAAHVNGVDIELAVDRLKTFKQPVRHLEVIQGINGATLIDDTWNTNSGSVQAALNVLNQISNGKVTIAVLGKISELGNEEETEHKKIADMVLENQINILMTIGESASIISTEAIRLGMNPDCVFRCKSDKDAKFILKELAGPDTIILVKTSMRESFKGFLKQLKSSK